MKLFLTSKAWDVMDTFVSRFDQVPTDILVGFVPTAGDVYDSKPFIESDLHALKELGFKVVEINIAGKTKSILQEEFKDIDILFVAGGNIFYLLEKTLESGFDKIIHEHIDSGKYFIGSSAGSCLLGSTIEPLKLLDDSSKAHNLKTLNGLGIINKMILPHYGAPKYQDRQEELLRIYSTVSVLKIRNDEAVIFQDGELKVISCSIK